MWDTQFSGTSLKSRIQDPTEFSSTFNLYYQRTMYPTALSYGGSYLVLPEVTKQLTQRPCSAQLLYDQLLVALYVSKPWQCGLVLGSSLG